MCAAARTTAWATAWRGALQGAARARRTAPGTRELLMVLLTLKFGLAAGGEPLILHLATATTTAIMAARPRHRILAFHRQSAARALGTALGTRALSGMLLILRFSGRATGGEHLTLDLPTATAIRATARPRHPATSLTKAAVVQRMWRSEGNSSSSSSSRSDSHKACAPSNSNASHRWEHRSQAEARNPSQAEPRNPSGVPAARPQRRNCRRCLRPWIPHHRRRGVSHRGRPSSSRRKLIAWSPNCE